MLPLLINAVSAANLKDFIALPKFCDSGSGVQELLFAGLTSFNVAHGYDKYKYDNVISATMKGSPNAFFAAKLADSQSIVDQFGNAVTGDVYLKHKSCLSKGPIVNTPFTSALYNFEFGVSASGSQTPYGAFSVEIAWDKSNLTNSRVASCVGTNTFVTCF